MIAHTEAAIKSEMNSRLVFGIGCIPMILIGIGLGILQRGGHLLGAFGASCVPAAVLGAVIISGKRLVETTGSHGSFRRPRHVGRGGVPRAGDRVDLPETAADDERRTR